MYVPAHFAMTSSQVRTVLEAGAAGDLVTVGPDGPVATYVPMLYHPDCGELGSLIGHVSLVNDQWRTPGPALFVLHGPDDYIESEWLSTVGSPSVPTWNYVTVQVHGRLVVHNDPRVGLHIVAGEKMRHILDPERGLLGVARRRYFDNFDRARLAQKRQGRADGAHCAAAPI